jgi:hypothetical protein
MSSTAGELGFNSQQGQEIFLSSSVQIGSGNHLSNGFQLFPWWGEVAKIEDVHKNPCDTEVKNAWSHTSAPLYV